LLDKRGTLDYLKPTFRDTRMPAKPGDSRGAKL
jgi:hypothetical protein